MILHFRAKKSLGQNFLIDKNIARKIVDLIQITANDLVVEIGPGRGILTQFFFEFPAEFICVEIDSRLVEFLQQKFAREANITIVHEDFLHLDLSTLDLTERHMKWVGNLPYHLTSPVLFRMWTCYPRVARAIFMVQKEVADRLIARVGTREYGILSVLVQTVYQVRREFSVPRTVFRPSPEVDSAVISFAIRKNFSLNCEMCLYERVIKTAFNQRRKQLKNSLQSIISRETMEWIPFDFSRRAEQITIEEWINLCQYLAPRKNLIRATNGSKPPLTI